MSELFAAYLVTCIRLRDMQLCYVVLKMRKWPEGNVGIHKKGSRDEMRAELCKIFIASYHRAHQPFLNPSLYSGWCVWLWGQWKILDDYKAFLLSKSCDSLSTLPLPRGLVIILSISLKFMLLEHFTALTDLLLVLFFYNLWFSYIHTVTTIQSTLWPEPS